MFAVALDLGYSEVVDPLVEGCFGNSGPDVKVFSGRAALWRSRLGIATFPDPRSEPRSCFLCIAVPKSVPIPEFLKKLSEFTPHIDGKHGILVVVDQPTSYFVALTANSADSADKMHTAYHCRPFSPEMEEFMLVLFLAVEFNQQVSCDDFLRLPSCVWCLERLESSVSGLVSTMCSHSRNCGCMLNSQCNTCGAVREKGKHLCSVEGCGGQSVWACLVCSFVGCGRYNNAHAVGHFHTTGHAFSIELNSQRVWDYEGDRYVHRLIHDVGCEREFLPDTVDEEIGGVSKSFINAKFEGKAEFLASEYTRQLSVLLEQQRWTYSERKEEMKKEHEIVLGIYRDELERLTVNANEWQMKLESAREDKTRHDSQLITDQETQQELQSALETLEVDNTSLRVQIEELKLRLEDRVKNSVTKRVKLQQRVSQLRTEVRELKANASLKKQFLMSTSRQELKEGFMFASAPAETTRKGFRQKKKR